VVIAVTFAPAYRPACSPPATISRATCPFSTQIGRGEARAFVPGNIAHPTYLGDGSMVRQTIRDDAPRPKVNPFGPYPSRHCVESPWNHLDSGPAFGAGTVRMGLLPGVQASSERTTALIESASSWRSGERFPARCNVAITIFDTYCLFAVAQCARCASKCDGATSWKVSPAVSRNAYSRATFRHPRPQ
jgi:hypothetical protein